MKMYKSLLAIIAIAATLSGCARIETGEVGLRVKFDKTTDPEELKPGSFNQVLVGDVLKFQTRSIAVVIDDKNPQTSDNSTLKDFDLTAIYDITPASVSDLWTKESRAFHVEDKGDYYLMYHYMTTVLNTAAYKAVRKYKALEVADNRTAIEQEIKTLVAQTLKEEKLDTAITLNQVQVRNTLPSDEIVASANAVVRATNELRAKTVEVQTAEQEAQRLKMLAGNSQSIDYMNAKALQDIAEGIKNGKVQTIVVPYDFKGIVNAGK
jgi:regulator of protease activity HflC (stomatin/prohibitin superfamily)